jgi:hypothetical protein
MYKNVIIFKENKIVKENTYSFGIFKKYSILDMKYSKFINYSTNMC